MEISIVRVEKTNPKRRNYTQEWFPAEYVGSDERLRGQRGAAKHVNGDTWRFKYLRVVGQSAAAIYRDCFRTEVRVEVER